MGLEFKTRKASGRDKFMISGYCLRKEDFSSTIMTDSIHVECLYKGDATGKIIARGNKKCIILHCGKFLSRVAECSDYIGKMNNFYEYIDYVEFKNHGFEYIPKEN